MSYTLEQLQKMHGGAPVAGGSTPPQKSFTYDELVRMKGNPISGAPKDVAPTAPAKPKEKGFFGRVWDEYGEAGKDITEGIKEGADQMAKGQFFRGAKTAALRTVGNVAEAAFAPIFEAPGIHQTLDYAGEKLAQVPLVQNIASGVNKFSETHPEVAKDIGNAFAIATLGFGKTAEKPVQEALESAGKKTLRVAADVGEGGGGAVGGVMLKTGRALEESGIKSAENARSNFLKELVRPARTQKVTESEVGRTVEKPMFDFFKKKQPEGNMVDKIGLKKESKLSPDTTFTYSEVAPSPQESRAIEALKKLDIVKEKNSFQGNFNAIEEGNIKKAVDLEDYLDKDSTIISHGETESALRKAQQDVAKNRALTGNVVKQAEGLVDDAIEISKKFPQTKKGRLQARRAYDVHVKKMAAEGKIYPEIENAFSIANRAVRDTFNSLIGKGSDDVVTQSLADQTALYYASDIVRKKAAQEANSIILRAFQKLGAGVGFRNKMIQILAGVSGVGGLGSAAMFAPVITGAGLGALMVYKAGKLVLNPEVRKLIGRALQQGGRRLAPAERQALEKQLKRIGMTEEELQAAKKRLKDYEPPRQISAPKVKPRIIRGDQHLSDYYPSEGELPVIDFGRPATPKGKKPLKDFPTIR